MAIERTAIFTFQYFHYGEAFHGSYRGMRFQVGRYPLENVFFKPKEVKESGNIRAYIWPEPFCFEKAPEDSIIYKDFAYSPAGVDEAVAWLNEIWEKDYERA